jgi:hypothetical protein
MFLLRQRKTPRSVVPTKGRHGWHDLGQEHTGAPHTERCPMPRFKAPNIRARLPVRSFYRRPAPADNSFATHRVRAADITGERLGRPELPIIPSFSA